MPYISTQASNGIKLGTLPSTSTTNLSTLNGNKLGSGVKWSSLEEVTTSRPTSSVPPAPYIRNRRGSLPANTLSTRPRTSLNDVFTAGKGASSASGEATRVVQPVNLSSAEKSATESAFSYRRLKRTATLSQNCRHLADLIIARSEAISRLDSGHGSETNSVDSEKIDDESPADKKQLSPRPPSQTSSAKRNSRLRARRGSTPCVPTGNFLIPPQEKRSNSSSPIRRGISPHTIPENSSETSSNGETSNNLGNLLAANRSGDSKNSKSASKQKPRDSLINLQRRKSIKEIDPNILVFAQKVANTETDGSCEEVQKHMRKVSWNMNSALTKSTADFRVAGKPGTPSAKNWTPQVGNKTALSRSDTPCSWSRRSDSEIAEQVEAELQIRVADRRRQLSNMMKCGRRLNALQMIGPRSHQSTKMLEHLPGSRLRKVLDEVDHNRTTNELIEVRIETLKVSLSL